MIPTKSLKWTLILSLVLAMAIPLAVTGAIFTRTLAQTMKASIISGNESLSYSFIDQIETYLATALDDLTTLRTMVEKQDFDRLNHTSLLDSIRQNKAYFTKIQIINRQGYTRFISPHDRQQINLDQSGNPVFSEPIRTGKPYWSPAFIDPDTGTVAVSVSIPFENGVMAGFLSLAHLSRAAAKITRDKAIRITITDQSSSYIVHYEKNLVLQRGYDPDYDRIRDTFKGQLISETRHAQGESMFITAGMIPKTDWAIVFSQPAETVFLPIRLFYLYMICGLIFLIGMTTLLCLRHINLVIRALERFSSHARGIETGSYDSSQVAAQYKEFHRLSNRFNDMTAAIQSREAALRENEEKYRSIFTAAQEAIILVEEAGGQILDVNEFACRLYQYDREDFLSCTTREIFAAPEELDTAIRDRQTWISKSEHKKKDGTRFTAELSLAFHRRSDEAAICTLVARDISQRLTRQQEKERMQMLLAQAQKMEAVGRLAGGIAHDFNNILTAIVGFAEMGRIKAPENSPLAQYNAYVLKAAQRAKALVSQILTFARSSKTEKKPVQVNLILSEVLNFIRATIPSSIEIRADIQTDCRVLADPIQLHQVVMNLCTNAWHAMKESGGTLSIRLSIPDQEIKTGTRTFDAGKTACLRVMDTGTGIDPKHLDKIFDPYFTTKKKGEGSGMGLSVVQGILRDMGGEIQVTSTPGRGSCFDILLPTTALSLTHETQDQGLPVRGTESLLLVDDEPDITRAMALMLESLGYTVQAENESRKALETFTQNPDRFDLVISDMTMPGMGGDVLAREIFKIRPDMKLIICTGFHETMTPEKARKMGVRDFLYKPVEKADLARSVRKALDLSEQEPGLDL